MWLTKYWRLPSVIILISMKILCTKSDIWKWCVCFHPFSFIGWDILYSPYIISPVAEAHLIRVLLLHDVHINQHIEMVTLIPRFPLSANSCAIVVSKTKQSEFIMAEETPSWIDLGVASHVNLRRWPFNSNLKQVKNLLILILLHLKGFVQFDEEKVQTYYLYAKFSACFLVPMSWTMAKNCWWPSNFSCFSNTSLKNMKNQ